MNKDLSNQNNKETNELRLIEALKGCVESLEYVERALPQMTGWGVRQQRIEEAKNLIEEIKNDRS